MFAFFDKIIGFFETIFGLITNVVKSLFTLLQALLSFITLPATLVPFLPSIIYAGLSITLSFAVIKIVVGR